MKKTQKEKGITLIALVVTIIVLLILAGITVTTVLGDDGIIAQAQLAAFATEMQEIKQNVDMKKVQYLPSELIDGINTELFSAKFNVNSEDYEILDTLKKEILYVRDGMPSDKSPDDYDVEEFDNLVDSEGNLSGIYVIDEATGNGKENTYIYDETTDTVFKIPKTKIGRKIYHSYECATHGKGGSSENSGSSNGTIQDESQVTNVDNVYYYGPNLKGFNGNKTYVVYYSADFTKTKEVLATEYIAGGQQREITVEGEKYTLHNYGTSKIWANVKTIGSNHEAWWVWIPRYAYKVNEDGKTADIIYVGLDNTPLDPNKNTLEEGYEVHPAFTTGGNLKGIWMSKYEPSFEDQITSSKVLAPDLTGFDPENTYIELYNGSDGFTEVKLSDANLNEINNNNQWYNYESKIWANVKTTGSNHEAWWVWVPRYAYRQVSMPGGHKMEIVYIDINNKPLDAEKYGTKLPKDFIVHPAFTEEGKNLKGIWMSKYEPSFEDQITSSKVLAPDMSGFDKNNTYIMLYDSSSETGFEETGKPLSEVMQGDTLTEEELASINGNNKWYDYENKIWANVKTTGSGNEAWWVWIPRYAYRQVNKPGGKIMEIVYIDTNNKPLDTEKYGDSLPQDFIVHPAFTGEGKNLKGIWMSKYEPSQTEE